MPKLGREASLWLANQLTGANQRASLRRSESADEKTACAAHPLCGSPEQFAATDSVHRGTPVPSIDLLRQCVEDLAVLGG